MSPSSWIHADPDSHSAALPAENLSCVRDTGNFKIFTYSDREEKTKFKCQKY